MEGGRGLGLLVLPSLTARMDFFIYDNVPRTDPDDRRDGSLPSESVLPSFFNSIVGFEATDATAGQE